MGTHPIFESDFDCLTDLIAQEREAEHQQQLLELENKLVKQSEYKQAELELELKKQASKNEKALADQKALQELNQQKYSQSDVRPRTYNNGHNNGYQSGQVNLLKMPGNVYVPLEPVRSTKDHGSYTSSS